MRDGQQNSEESKVYSMDDVRVGQRVTWSHGMSAISGGMNGRTSTGSGVIARIWDFKYDPPIGVHVDGTDGRRLRCIFACEILTLEDPEIEDGPRGP